MNKDQLFALAQHITPQKTLSRLIGKIAECENTWVKDTFIKHFISKYKVDMNEAIESDPTSYKNFNAFFTRAIKPELRPIASEANAIACPADGAISQLGKIEYGTLLQAKGSTYSLTSLLGGDAELSNKFIGGKFATVYLSPKDYHRVHMPIDGKLIKMIHIPGKLFSVNKVTAEQIPNVFARNERTVCIFETAVGPMAVILVGAMIVASIETIWAGQVTPFNKNVVTWDYDKLNQVELKKGEEMGRFKLGSTAIVLFGEDANNWEETLEATTPTTMGMPFGTINL
ncbi:rhodanese domain protein/phosphatidylserine decarboxylase [Marinomonas sp. MED121]|uniref:archaetidylserine decarboxylase n=1 Tax=Marinomonas sp. MED121 TaxID=314277 RepID=UPI00006909DB|nr:archaetidylserine decarboxylase [Marinomonas sp. MED121]EAQ63983.1 rhodanese domain protein/phosphatidylserine decarboxylase [Marinomonas sp. MED121]